MGLRPRELPTVPIAPLHLTFEQRRQVIAEVRDYVRRQHRSGGDGAADQEEIVDGATTWHERVL
jgi:hypothetical protein